MYINNLSYELYKFVLKFLKLQKSSYTKKGKMLIFSASAALIFYLFFVATILFKNILGIKISAALMFVSVCVTIYCISLFNKEQQKINHMKVQLQKYRRFKQKFHEKYGIEVEESLLQKTIDELSKSIELEIERSKYTFDKILSIMTLTPILAVFLSFGKVPDSNQYDPSFIVIAIVCITVVGIHFFTKSIYFPQFKEVEKKQRVLSFLTGCLLELKINDDSLEDIEKNEEDEVEILDSENRNLDCNIRILFGVFSYYNSYVNEEHKLSISFLWGMLKIDFTKTKTQRECNIKFLWKLIDICRKSEWNRRET